MDYAIARRSEQLPALPLRHIGVGSHGSDIYVLFENEVPRWQVAVGWGEASSFPFREEVIWVSAGVAIIGGGTDAYFLDLHTGESRLHMPVRSYFGHLALHRPASADQELLFILGGTDVLAYRTSLSLHWRAEDIAVDGITFGGVEGTTVLVSAEMDPPGGWFAVELDLATGREISRRPDFSDEYRGIYGSKE